jgi:hypothetical protein
MHGKPCVFNIYLIFGVYTADMATAKDNQKHYIGALLEDINDKLALILETVVPMQKDVMQLKKDMTGAKSHLGAVENLLRSHDRDIIDHEHRITSIEKTVL